MLDTRFAVCCDMAGSEADIDPNVESILVPNCLSSRILSERERNRGMELIEDRVKRGAEWLDSIELDWQRKITVTDLDIDCGCYCVIGQVFGSYHEAIGLGRLDWARAHGFAVYADRHDDNAFDRECKDLEDAWARLIYERR